MLRHTGLPPRAGGVSLALLTLPKLHGGSGADGRRSSRLVGGGWSRPCALTPLVVVVHVDS
eukprot:6562765-Alexandrium_andersonii.AAC.1